jgi:hypothetical protein
MADRRPSLLTRLRVARIAVLVVGALGATAGLTYAAGSRLSSAPAVPTVSSAPAEPLVVPDVRNQAFVFAKGTLEEAGFSWLVSGSVHGYSSNVVISQSPAPGTRVIDAGAPRITLVLKRGSYPQNGEAQDASPYSATAPQPADLAGRAIGPAAPAAGSAAPAQLKAATKAKTVAVPDASATASWPQQRPAAFDVPGGRKEPLTEMPLPNRAKSLAAWLDTHQTSSPASEAYWLYQNEWVVAGAKLGWWHGAEALETLIAVDHRAQSLWGIGSKSADVAQQALSEVQARSR